MFVTMLFAACFYNVTYVHAESNLEKALDKALGGQDYVINVDGTVTVTVEITDELKRKCEETGKRLENFIDPDDPKMILDSDDLAAIEENTGIIIDENEMPTLSEIMALSSVLEPNESKTATEKNKLWMHSFGTEKPGNNAYAMQNFYNGDYLYVTQNINGTVYLSRYYVSRDGYYHYVDHMTINNAGHGQTLEEFTYGGKTYFLMTLTENPIDGIYWSTDIGCVEYKGGTTINSNNQKRFVGIKVNGKTDVKRVDAALSSDKSQIAIWKKNADNEIEICTYSFDEFKKILLNDTTGTTASISKLTEKHSINDSDLDFPKSFQGIELSNEVDGVSSIYIAGGNESEDDMPLVIARYNTNGN